MMNVPQKLATEISRVTMLRERYKSFRGMGSVNVEPAIALMTHAIDAAIQAAGVNDALTQIDALKNLEGFTE